MAVTECVTRSVDRLEFGGGVLSTACSPAVVADMLCRGELSAHTAVLTSARCVPYAPLFDRRERSGEEVEQEAVLPLAGRVAPVAAHGPDAAEADALVAADRPLVGRSRVDR